MGSANIVLFKKEKIEIYDHCCSSSKIQKEKLRDISEHKLSKKNKKVEIVHVKRVSRPSIHLAKNLP